MERVVTHTSALRCADLGACYHFPMSALTAIIDHHRRRYTDARVFDLFFLPSVDDDPLSRIAACVPGGRRGHLPPPLRNELYSGRFTVASADSRYQFSRVLWTRCSELSHLSGNEAVQVGAAAALANM